jgi:hypothetical protein
MPFPLAGVAGGILATRVGHAISMGARHASAQAFLRSPLIQGGQFGIGYTGGAYGGYGATNTWDPFGIHKPKYKYYQQKLRLPYGYYGRRYTRFRRYRGYRRRYPYYRRYRY